MKTIIFHGLLKKLFCKQIKLNILNFKDIFKSLSCNYVDYNKKINKIKKSCFGFCVVVDGKLFFKDSEKINHDLKDASVIEIIPCAKLGVIGSLIAALVAIGLSKFWAAVVSFLVVAIVSVGISFLVSFLLMKKGPGSASFVKTSSYIFSNKENIAQRNTPVAINYGRLKLGSSIINGLIFNFDLSYKDNSNILISESPSEGLILASI